MKPKLGKFKRFVKKRNLNPRNNRKKVGIILFTTSIGLFFLFAIRLGYVVLGGYVAGTSLAAKTEELYNGTEVVKAKRGSILDRTGNIIAESSVTYSVHAVLSETYVDGDEELYAHTEDFATLASILSQNIDVTEEYALSRLQDGMQNNSYQVEFGSKGKNLSLETRQKIQKAMADAEVVGLYFDESTDRIYPNGDFATYLIGYANAESGSDLAGQMGMEASYNSLLAGQNGVVEYEKNNLGNPLPGTVAEETPAVDGADIYTTIDSRLQSYLESLMAPVYEAVNPENLTAVLMKAKTGEIVAMSQRPSFNPENMDDVETWLNLLVEDSYEPGSTIKVATVAAAIDQGVFDENYSYYTDGKITVEDTTINDHDHGKKGPLTMRQALSWSSNVGMVMLEQRMGGAVWQDYLAKLGLGESTYSGLNGETPGILPTENIVDTAMSAYGQSVAVNQMQMLKIFSAIANKGKMLQPHFIDKVVDSNGDTTVVEPEVVGQPFSEDAADSVLQYMRDVIESPDYGTAYGQYSLEGHNISAKTGTAQVASEDGSGYLSGSANYIYSVVLMYPTDDPEYILYLTMKKPESYSSTAFASIANPLMKRSMDILSAETTDTDESTKSVTVADYQEQGKNSAATAVRQSFLNPIVLGTGDTVIGQSIAAGEVVDPNTRLVLLTDGNIAMPDTTDWTKSELEALGKLLDVEVTIEGSGTCVAQSVDPGAILTTDSVTFTLGS